MIYAVIRIFVFFALSLVCLAPSWAQTTTEASAVDYRLGAGDKIRVTVYGEADLSGDFEVDGTGTISMPLLGPQKIGSMRLRDVEALIRDQLAAGYLKNPRLSVEVLNYRPFYIYGEVRNPGSFPYVYGMKMLNAIVLAGGYTGRARKERFLVTRVIDGQKIEQQFDDDGLVMPGDIIRVPERYF